MNTLWHLVNLLVFTQFVACRDFYLGMFRRNDFLVAQDAIYKAPAPFGVTTAVYGRLFKCPITYFRVVDRLGQGRGPITTIVRGGLRKKFISVRIKSTYMHPISVNIYVGCENKQPSTFKTTRMLTISTISTTSSSTTPSKVTDSVPGNTGKGTTKPSGDTEKIQENPIQENPIQENPIQENPIEGNPETDPPPDSPVEPSDTSTPNPEKDSTPEPPVEPGDFSTPNPEKDSTPEPPAAD